MGEPQVAYREAITQSATVEYVHKKQSGGSGQYAKVSRVRRCSLCGVVWMLCGYEMCGGMRS